MLIDEMEYAYQDLELSIDCLDPYINDEISPWDKFSVDGMEDAFGPSGFEDFNFDLNGSQYLSQDLMWSSGSGDLEEVTKLLKIGNGEKTPVSTKPSPPPPAVVNPPNQRSLLIKSQPQYHAPSSASLSPPISDDESSFPEPKTDTLKCLEEHITQSVLNVFLDSEILEYLAEPSDNETTPLALPSPPRVLSPPPRPSFEIDHCYSKEVEPEDDEDGHYESNLGVDTPSDTGKSKV